jgi:hypothetical protein
MDAMAEMPPTSMPAFDPQPLLATLVRHEVRFVLIGALAATLHGSPIRTNDADITPDRSPGNLERLAAALVELDARVWTPDQPQGFAFDRSAEMLARSDIWNLMTRYGQLDISFTPSGTRGYPDLARHAVTRRLWGIDIPIASLVDIIRSKEAAGREKDRAMLPTLRKLAAYIADEERR